MKKPLSKRHQLIVHISYKLLHFLIKENALSSYMENVLSHNQEATVILSFKNDPDYIYLGPFTHGFAWSRTKQGFKYWSNLNTLWCEEADKK